MSDYRKALEDIVEQCSASKMYSRRTQVIHEIAMKALGLTANQRHAAHMAILQRIGDDPLREAYLKRKEKRDAKLKQEEEMQ